MFARPLPKHAFMVGNEPRSKWNTMRLLDHLLRPYSTAVRHRDLIWRMARREIDARTKSTSLGTIWLVVSPLLLLSAYTFVFTFIFKSRWDIPDSGQGNVALFLFSGMTVFGIASECINRAPGLVLENVSYVKKVVFPLEILPWISLISAVVLAGINFGLLLLAHLLFFGLPPATALLLPLVLLPLLLMTMGLSWLLASLGVFLRDIKHITGFLVTFMMFLGPVFYPLSAVPESLRGFMYLNPITLAIEQTRQVMFWGQMPSLAAYVIALAAGLAVSSLGFAWFMKTRKGFADVL
ncbi:ABC transporter permease [Azospirillum sp. TSH58]|uniref:ABC transporter permease n=1 Tax=Azospirillum sp. TSH58 TaxID=664962 RepID=UPI00200056BD|nr:ABC transporter permease [Azospirillum sp. TSH58]